VVGAPTGSRKVTTVSVTAPKVRERISRERN
jgi:hypothetical protein